MSLFEWLSAIAVTVIISLYKTSKLESLRKMGLISWEHVKCIIKYVLDLMDINSHCITYLTISIQLPVSDVCSLWYGKT